MNNETTELVINVCHGGFGISPNAEAEYCFLANITDPEWNSRTIARDDPILVQIVKNMGEGADGIYSSLKIVEIPSDVEWVIGEYDGLEWVAEKHRTWS
jgi:hypothetical protein